MGFSMLIFSGGVKIPTGFSSRFTQKITSPKHKIIRYSGSIYFNRSGALKWKYDKPIKKEVCSQGTTFEIVDHDLEQVSFHRLEHALDLASILQKARHHKDNLYVASYREVLYTFAVDSKGRLEQIAYKDTLDNVVNIHFQKMHYRKKPNAAKTMQCPYPEAYDIIRG